MLVFGESENDRRAIRHLTEGLRSDLRNKVETRRQPLVLIKDADAERARSNAQKIAALVKQESAARNVLAVITHQDCDALEPAHVAVAQKIENHIKAAGCATSVVAAAPAWEIEAWWMLFPEAVGRLVLGWRDPDDWIGRDVGKVKNAKEALASAVQPRPPTKSPPREYEESDSVAIAENIDQMGLHPSFQDGARFTKAKSSAERRTLSASFEAFRKKVLAIPPPST